MTVISWIRLSPRSLRLIAGNVRYVHGNYSAYAAEKSPCSGMPSINAYLNQQRDIKHQEAVIAKLKSFQP